ncbi:MAG: NAD(P)/FAD-dependent oxidoreductase [Acidobacteria bacterium]|nr:NAD(P)/FAD-dependent oxidoreductase [Acidobacteriota bacterium]
MPERDLVVVGGGPAGLAVAIRARLAGLSVTVVDRGRPPLDHACGEGLLPDTVGRLAALGIDPGATGGVPFFGIRYVCGELTAEGRFAGPPAWGIRRTTLHDALARRATALGAELRWGTTARGLAPDGIALGGGTLAARLVVGADGRHSAVRRWAGLEGTPARRDRHAVRRHLGVRPWTDLVEVTWAEQAEAYVTPVGDRQVSVALIWNGGPSGFDTLLRRFPRLAARLAGAPIESRDRGASRLGARPRALHTGRVALVGDAAGGIDPISGEGVSLAFRGADALVAAVVAGDLERYERASRRFVRAPRFLAATLLLLERSARLRRGAVAALAADPALFSRLLAFHTGELAPWRLGLGATARLVARSLAGAPAGTEAPSAA